MLDDLRMDFTLMFHGKDDQKSMCGIFMYFVGIIGNLNDHFTLVTRQSTSKIHWKKYANKNHESLGFGVMQTNCNHLPSSLPYLFPLVQIPRWRCAKVKQGKRPTTINCLRIERKEKARLHRKLYANKFKFTVYLILQNLLISHRVSKWNTKFQYFLNLGDFIVQIQSGRLTYYIKYWENNPQSFVQHSSLGETANDSVL